MWSRVSGRNGWWWSWWHSSSPSASLSWPPCFPSLRSTRYCTLWPSSCIVHVATMLSVTAEYQVLYFVTFLLHRPCGHHAFRHCRVPGTVLCDLPPASSTWPPCFFLTETFCYGDVLCGDVLSRRCFVTGDVLIWRRSVTGTFCMEMFCRGDVLYVSLFSCVRGGGGPWLAWGCKNEVLRTTHIQVVSSVDFFKKWY
jgi:hypothetical protein